MSEETNVPMDSIGTKIIHAANPQDTQNWDVHSTMPLKPTVDEEALSPIYPKMVDLVHAATEGTPIPVDSDAVKAIEKDYPTAAAADVAAIRATVDMIDQIEDTSPLKVIEAASVTATISAGTITSGMLAATTTTASTTIENINTRIDRLCLIGAANSVLIIMLIIGFFVK